MTAIIQSLSEIADRYDALFCDLWGCYHNGVAPYPAAVAALRAFRQGGGAVVLMTNAPRSADLVAAQLARMGAPEDSFDAIVSSGDAARAEVAEHRYGRRVLYVGPERDLSFFAGVDVELVDAARADSVVVIGLRDDSSETPEDYAAEIADWAARGLPMLCANPDVVVDRGDVRLWCAGALAEAYAAAGGAVHFSGKPHPAIYRLGRAVVKRLRGPEARILALGDGVMTDVAGGAAEGLDALFVTGGLAAEAVSDDPETPDQARLRAFLAAHDAAPRYAIGRLR
jgi:HAD superfamily hydrolase (TIGR01459 family)